MSAPEQIAGFDVVLDESMPPNTMKFVQPEQEPVVHSMTAKRAVYFMERFKHEEKLLGPNEQAAVDFVIALLDAQQEQQPVAHFGSAYVNENGVHITTVLGPVEIPQNAKLYTHPQPKREPLTDEQERAAFEQHWYDFYHCGSISARTNGTYIHPAVQKAWEAWQARAAHGIKE